jgi:hypothetical protein
MKLWLSAAVLGAALVCGTVAVDAQERGGAPDEPVVSPFELQRLFDSYALLQAQEQLKIGDEQYARFLPRFKALQDVRRQMQQQRARVIQDVRRLLMDGQTDEAQLRDRLKQLQDRNPRRGGDAQGLRGNRPGA